MSSQKGVVSLGFGSFAGGPRVVPGSPMISRRTLLRAAMAATGEVAGLGRFATAGAFPLPNGITATVNAETLNVRTGPSTGDPVRGKLHQGDRVNCVSTSDDWFQITTPRVAGYVYSPYVTLDAAGPAKFVPRGLESRPLVCLTFDCGADRGYAEQIINLLASHKATSSFGMTGHWADENPDLTRRIAADGHHFINHTRTHRSFTGASTNTAPLSPAERLEELEWTEAKLKQLIGRGAKPWFRTPYTDGDDDPGVLRDIAADGFTYDLGFTVDTLGWAGATEDEIVARVMSHNGNGYIYLLHVGAQSQDAAALERILTGLRDAGYEFGTAPEVLGVSVSPPATPNASPAASPGASPAASPSASPAASPSASPAATP